MEKSLSYSTLASPCESGNRERENINLGKTSKSGWGFGSLGSSALCYKGTPGAPSRGKVVLVSGPTCPQGQAVHIFANPHFTSKVLECLDKKAHARIFSN